MVVMDHGVSVFCVPLGAAVDNLGLDVALVFLEVDLRKG